MRVYIAGPMRGYPNWNSEAFARASEIWRRAGHQPFSPAAIAIALGYWLQDGEDIHTPRAAPITPEGRQHLQHVMSMDVACLMAANAIALLPGWENSTGATVEVSIAQFFALQTFDAITMEPMIIPPRPWSNLMEGSVIQGPIVDMATKNLEKETRSSTTSPAKILTPVDHSALQRAWEILDAVELRKARASLEKHISEASKPVPTLSKPESLKQFRVVQGTVICQNDSVWVRCCQCGKRFMEGENIVDTLDGTGGRFLYCEPCCHLVVQATMSVLKDNQVFGDSGK